MTRPVFGWYRGATRDVSAWLLPLLLAMTFMLFPGAGDAASDAPPAATGELLFTKLSPDIIVNLRGSGSHYLMVTAQLQTRRPEDILNAQRHLPALRHNLLMMMGGFDYREAMTLEGRQKLADESLAIVRRVLDEEAGSNAVEAVLFTSYLVE